MNNPIQPLTPQQEATAQKNVEREGYLKRDLVALDQDVATDLGDKVPDETISAWTARLSLHARGLPGFLGRTVSRVLDWFQKNHGAKAIAGDDERGKEVQAAEQAAGVLPKE